MNNNKNFFHIKSGDTIVGFKAPRALNLDNEFAAAYIPSYFYIEKQNTLINSEGVIDINIGPDTIDFICKLENISIKISKKSNSKDIVSVIEYILEFFRQKKGIYCVHSSTVIYKGRAIIFWGGVSNIGKTRTALVLSKIKGNMMYSDEKTLVDLRKNIVCGGVRKIYLLKEEYKKTITGDNFSLTTLQSDEKFEILCFININNFGDVLNNESKGITWDKGTFSWHLYEELTRKIRGVSRRVNSFLDPISCIDTEIVSRNRSDDVNNYCEMHNGLYMRGSEQFIINYINNYYEKNSTCSK